MSEHIVNVQWARKTPDFAYDTYDRTHQIKFAGGQTLTNSSAPQYLGKAEYSNPEELLAAALATCHMLTFLAVVSKMRLTVDSYECKAVAHLDKNAAQKMAVTKISLYPHIKFSGETPDADKLKQIHDKAHHNCFVGNSINCVVEVL